MKVRFIITLCIVIANSINAQVSMNSGNWMAKEWSKDISVFRSNEFLIKNILGNSDEISKFENIALASSNSGEITTLLYRSETKEKEGLLLCFYGNYWNDSGVEYQGYGFKNFNKDEAFNFLNKLQEVLDATENYRTNNNTTAYAEKNVSFKYGDMDLLISNIYGKIVIRIFWKGFDSSWDFNSYKRSKKRFEKKI